jgi:hypothetical protein
MMKKIVLAAFAAAVLVLPQANAQTHDVSINLAPMAFGNYSGNYSFNFNENMSAGSVFGYQNLEVGSGEDKVGFKGFYVAPEYRYYFNPEKDNDGFFAGGYLKYRNMGTTGGANRIENWDGTTFSYDEKNSGLALGVITGKVWIARNGITFSTWAGLGYYLFNETTYTNGYKPDESLETNLPALDFRLGLSVGYRFGM